MTNLAGGANNIVELYEDNAGGLFLVGSEGEGEGGYYAGLEYVPAGQFMADAVAMLAGDVSNWTAEHYSGAAPGQLVAVVSVDPRGRPALRVVGKLGRSAERYVGKLEGEK